MAENDTPEQLSERLKAATGPDRELDAAIFAAVFPDKVPTPIVESGYGWRAGRGYWWLATGEDSRTPPKTVTPPDFTTSIDAAIKLKPDGCGLLLTATHMECWASIVAEGKLMDGTLTTGPSIASARAATPALAICLAALRASGLA